MIYKVIVTLLFFVSLLPSVKAEETWIKIVGPASEYADKFEELLEGKTTMVIRKGPSSWTAKKEHKKKDLDKRMMISLSERCGGGCPRSAQHLVDLIRNGHLLESSCIKDMYSSVLEFKNDDGENLKVYMGNRGQCIEIEGVSDRIFLKKSAYGGFYKRWVHRVRDWERYLDG